MDRTLDLGLAADLAEGESRSSGPVTVLRHDGKLHAIASRCPHMGYPMSKGTLRDGVVTCAWHGWEFDLHTGGCYRGACDDLPVYPLDIIDGTVRVRYSETPRDPAEAARRLRESLLAGDVYLQAKALARLLDAEVAPTAIAATVVQHGFVHAIAAHRSIQACVEARAVLDAAQLAELIDPGERVATLLQGIRTVGGPVGERAAIAPLPGPLTSARLFNRLTAAVSESSSLGVERVVLSLAAHGTPASDIGSAVLDCASRPMFCEQPEILSATITALEAGERLGPDGWNVTAALLGWVLGAARGEPSAEFRPAREWLDRNAATLNAVVPPEHGRAPDDHSIASITTAQNGEAVMTQVLAWFRAGAGWADLLSGIECFVARRLERQAPGSGGLVPAALEGLRWVHAARRAARRGNAATRVNLIVMLAWHLFSSRWLQPGHSWQDKPSDATWERYAEAVNASDVSNARHHAVALLTRDRADSRALGQWLTPLIHDDLSGSVLDGLNAVVAIYRRNGEWQPAAAGLVNAVLDARMRQDVRAAARFGRSM